MEDEGIDEKIILKGTSRLRLRTFTFVPHIPLNELLITL